MYLCHVTFLYVNQAFQANSILTKQNFIHFYDMYLIDHNVNILDVLVYDSYTEVEEGLKFSPKKLESLGWKYRPLEETLVDAIKNFEEKGLLDKPNPSQL